MRGCALAAINGAGVGVRGEDDGAPSVTAFFE